MLEGLCVIIVFLSLKKWVTSERFDLNEMRLTHFRNGVQDVFAPFLSRSFLTWKDIFVVPEAAIIASMNRLAYVNNWDNSVNLDSDGVPYSPLKSIFAVNDRKGCSLHSCDKDSDNDHGDEDLDNDLSVACPGVVAGTIMLIARDLLKDKPSAQIHLIMEEDKAYNGRVSELDIRSAIRFSREKMFTFFPNISLSMEMTDCRRRLVR